MKRIFFILCILSLYSCKTKLLTKSSWETIEIPAPSLENSIIKNNITQTIGIYLPASYKSNPKKHYPVIYYLNGYGQGINTKGYTCWILDSLINKNQVPEMIFVSISGKYEFGGSFYENSPVTGNWEDFVIKDVTNYIDDNYRTIPKSESRALSGHSMGGYGALNLGMKHPDIYKVIYGMSPALFDKNGLKNCQMHRIDGALAPLIHLQEELAGLSKENAHDRFLAYKNNIKDWATEFTLAYGLCFAPKTDKAPYFEYPVTVVDNDTIINQQIWDKWDKGFGNVSNEINEYAENLRQLNLLALDCGYNDHYQWITNGTEYYTHELKRLKIPFLINWHQGTHGSHFVQSVHYGLFPISAAHLSFEEQQH